MNITIVPTEKDGIYIRVEIEHYEPFFFYRAGASKIETKLLVDRLCNELETQMEHIRRTSYRMGWREAKSKKAPKRTWFAKCLQVLPWEIAQAGKG